MPVVGLLGEKIPSWVPDTEKQISESFQIERNMIVGDSFPFDYEPNGIPFGLYSKGKLSLRS